MSGMELSFQKTILNVKTGTPGKGVLFGIYGENDIDNRMKSGFMDFYMKKMQIGTKKSYRVKNALSRMGICVKNALSRMGICAEFSFL